MLRIELIGGMVLSIAALVYFGNIVVSPTYKLIRDPLYIIFIALILIGVLLIFIAIIGKMLRESKFKAVNAVKMKKKRA